MSNNTSFDRRHRPQCFNDLIFADPNVEASLRSYAERNRYGSILLHGTFGTAKSTTAEMIIRGRHSQIGIVTGHIERFTGVQLRAVDIGVVENALNIVITTNGFDSEPYVIIDEIDMASPAKQAELRYLIDTKQVAKFIMTTNDLHKVDKGLVDRSDRYLIAPPNAQHMLSRAQTILQAEHVSVPNHIVQKLLQNAVGVRDMLRELERLVVNMNTQPQSPPPTPLPPTPSKVPAFTVLQGGDRPPSS